MTGLRRYANKRDASEPAIVTALEDMGVFVWRLNRPVDLLLIYRGEVMLAEVKTPGTQYGKKLNEDQQRIALLTKLYELRTVDDAVALVNSMQEAA